jgi:hypothetical protein
MSEPYPFKMKKLLHYISLDGVGGVEILFHELFKALSGQHHSTLPGTLY